MCTTDIKCEKKERKKLIYLLHFFFWFLGLIFTFILFEQDIIDHICEDDDIKVISLIDSDIVS